MLERFPNRFKAQYAKTIPLSSQTSVIFLLQPLLSFHFSIEISISCPIVISTFSSLTKHLLSLYFSMKTCAFPVEIPTVSSLFYSDLYNPLTFDWNLYADIPVDSNCNLHSLMSIGKVEISIESRQTDGWFSAIFTISFEISAFGLPNCTCKHHHCLITEANVCKTM